MKVIITERELLKVVGMKIRTNIKENLIPQLWIDFIARMEELDEIAVPNCSLGVCLYEANIEHEETEMFDYLVCKVVKNDSLIPSGMVYHEIPAQLVAVFTHLGSLDTLGDTYDYIYNKWLPQSEYKIVEADEVEWYDSRFKYGEKESQMDIHIPISKKDENDVIDEDILFNIEE